MRHAPDRAADVPPVAATSSTTPRTKPAGGPVYAEVTANSAGYSWSGLVFCWMGGVAFWLLQGERDRGADEFEGVPLGAGRLGEHRDGDLGSGVADLVAGEGGQVLDQAAEAAVGLPGRVVLAGGLGLGGRGAAGCGDGAGRGGRVLVGEGERGPGPAQVPGQVAGEHADQHVG